MIMRETTKVTGIATTEASSGANRSPAWKTPTTTYTPAVVTRKLVAFVSGNSRNFRSVGRVR